MIIANSDRTLMRMAATDIDKSEPIATAASMDKPIFGTPYIPLAVVGVMQLDALNSEYIVMLLRDIDEWLDQGAYLPRQVSLTPMTLPHAARNGTRGAGRLWAACGSIILVLAVIIAMAGWAQKRRGGAASLSYQ